DDDVRHGHTRVGQPKARPPALLPHRGVTTFGETARAGFALPTLQHLRRKGAAARHRAFGYPFHSPLKSGCLSRTSLVISAGTGPILSESTTGSTFLPLRASETAWRAYSPMLTGKKASVASHLPARMASIAICDAPPPEM